MNEEFSALKEYCKIVSLASASVTRLRFVETNVYTSANAASFSLFGFNERVFLLRVKKKEEGRGKHAVWSFRWLPVPIRVAPSGCCQSGQASMRRLSPAGQRCHLQGPGRRAGFNACGIAEERGVCRLSGRSCSDVTILRCFCVFNNKYSPREPMCRCKGMPAGLLPNQTQRYTDTCCFLFE